jgi:rubredoxin
VTLPARYSSAHENNDADAVQVTATTLQRWICESCGYIYDPEEGDPDGGIPSGTPFEEIPDTWFCPVCGARKRDFTLYED